MIDLPPLHPIFVNFTAALVPVSLVSDLLGRWMKRPSLTSAGWWTMCYAAIATPVTVATGWLWFYGGHSGGHVDAIMGVHQWLGTAMALLIPVVAYWRWRSHRVAAPPGAVYLATVSAIFLSLIFQGHIGGTMSFGSGGGFDPTSGMTSELGSSPNRAEHHHGGAPAHGMKEPPATAAPTTARDVPAATRPSLKWGDHLEVKD